jgi:hypothetical protein
MIRVYDDAGNVNRDARAQRRFQRCGKKWLNLSRISPNTRSLQAVIEQKVRILARQPPKSQNTLHRISQNERFQNALSRGGGE